MTTSPDRVRMTPQGRSRATKIDAARGLVWVEAYLPLDLDALADWTALEAEVGQEAAIKQDPDLFARAITPIDSQGEGMTADQLELLAHRYLAISRKMDADHDLAVRDSVQVVESFINGPEIASPHFYPGAWVTVLKFDTSSPEWDRVQKGDLQAVSFMAYVDRTPITFRSKEA